MQRTVAQCTPNPARANRRFSGRTRPFFAFALAAVCAASAPQLSAQTVPVEPGSPATPAAAVRDPMWNEGELLEILRRIYLLIGGDPLLWPIFSDAPSCAMTLIIAVYDAGGIPPGLTPAEIDLLVTDIDRASCMLQSAPPTEDPALIQQMQDALFGMWIELGQPIGELGC